MRTDSRGHTGAEGVLLPRLCIVFVDSFSSPLRVRAVGWRVGGLVGGLVCVCVCGRGGLNLRTAIPKGALVAEKYICKILNLQILLCFQ